MGAGDVEVGEVGGIGFVDVVVAVVGCIIGGCDERGEEVFGRNLMGLAVDLVDDSAEDAVLFVVVRSALLGQWVGTSWVYTYVPCSRKMFEIDQRKGRSEQFEHVQSCSKVSCDVSDQACGCQSSCYCWEACYCGHLGGCWGGSSTGVGVKRRL